VLDQVSFTVRSGPSTSASWVRTRGQSTLLGWFAGIEAPDSGEVSVHADGGTGHLGQTAGPARREDRAGRDHARWRPPRLERRMRAANRTRNPRTPQAWRVRRSCCRRSSTRGLRGRRAVDAALHGLGLAALTRDRLLAAVRRERARLALACLVAYGARADALDDRPNHLDGDALTWLEDRLRAHRGTRWSRYRTTVCSSTGCHLDPEVDGERRTVARLRRRLHRLRRGER